MADDVETVMVEIPTKFLGYIERLISPVFSIVHWPETGPMVLPRKYADQARAIIEHSVPAGDGKGLMVDPEVLQQTLGLTDQETEDFFNSSKKEKEAHDEHKEG